MIIQKNVIFLFILITVISLFYVKNSFAINNDLYKNKNIQPAALGADQDEDGIADALDNCSRTFNPNQADTDNDNIGDVCDNCPDTENPDQEDNDYDNIGNGCDNCVHISNRMQEDGDNDDIGDVCDCNPGVQDVNEDFDYYIGLQCQVDRVGDCPQIGIQTCQNGRPECLVDPDQVVEPTDEICDGIDNDCDDDIDEDLVTPDADKILGVCVGSKKGCGAEMGWIEPKYSKIDTYEAEEVTCDGLDNDCDGATDEGCDPDNPAGANPTGGTGQPQPPQGGGSTPSAGSSGGCSLIIHSES